MQAIDAAGAPAIIDMKVAAIDPLQFDEPLAESSIPGLGLEIGLGERAQNADAPHPLGLLRACRERPHRRRRTGNPLNEIAPSHCCPSRLWTTPTATRLQQGLMTRGMGLAVILRRRKFDIAN